MYDLRRLGGKRKPDDTKPAIFREWAHQGGFPDNTLFHLHCRYRPEFSDAIEATPAHVVTIVRDPYDAFVSRYYWTQQQLPKDMAKAEHRPRQRMVGKPIDDPEVLAFLADANGFGSHLVTANDWLHSGRAAVVRYEELHRDPVAALKDLTDRLVPTDRSRIDAALERCSAENMRARAKKKPWNIRVAKVGDSKDQLGEAHLAIFRDQYSELIRALGYDVR